MKIKQKNTIDMTHGTLWNKLLIFALPLAASSILQQLFNSVDTAVVGRFASSHALAAVGSNSSLIALMINLFIGISLGSNVIISRYIGQKAEEHVKRGNSHRHRCRFMQWHFRACTGAVHCQTGTDTDGNAKRCSRSGSFISADLFSRHAIYHAL